ncbi:ABC transporter permease [Microbacterium aurantiacum]|uniref:ABC transporter permease n=1 Tax=Microbacterium aurantiacum TaxID=162393 RepID=UPI000C8071C2|nr:ABC transporter permease [Microbacterium aurantiacum]
MLRFLARKLVAGAVLFLVVTAVTYMLVFANGENSVRQSIGENATDEQVARRVAELGLDRPVLTQYLGWLGGLLTGSLGRSFFTGEEVTDMMATRIPVTLSLVLLAMVFTTLLSVVIGVVAAVKGGWVDRVLQLTATAATALPSFLVAIALVFMLAIAVRVFPATGYVAFTDDPAGWVIALTLPVAAILFQLVAGAAQQFRGAMVDAMKADFIRTLRSRGVPERAIVFRHALRNAASPGLTVLSLQTISLIGGAVLIEQVFALPGIGRWTVTTSLTGDLPAVMGVVVFSTLVIVLVNIVADVANGWVNPKVRLS